ncbi:MAG: LPS export ABC transporter permease LptG [Gammaproteobacteria bacterium]|nr:LPS export ABC transporter permease LptG [Gammaproteobacteria bacterium]
MSRLQWYLARTILAATLATLALLVGIWGLFELLDQLGDTGRGSYDSIDALRYTLLSLAPQAYRFLPLAGLLGALTGLGMLASHSELTVMRAAGVSTGQLAGMVLRTALVLALGAALLGEGWAPEAKRQAEELRQRAIHGDKGYLGSEHGLWARDGHDFVHIGQLTPGGRLLTLIRYRLDEAGVLQSLSRAESADYLGEGTWRLNRVQTSLLQADGVGSTQAGSEAWHTTLSPDTLGVVVVAPDDMGLLALAEYRQYLRDNNLASGPYDLAYWRKLLQPLATALMMFVGMSFVFGPMRSVSMGARILVGIATGFGFYLANAVFGPLSLVYGLSPVLAAALPLAVFAALGSWLLKRAG